MLQNDGVATLGVLPNVMSPTTDFKHTAEDDIKGQSMMIDTVCCLVRGASRPLLGTLGLGTVGHGLQKWSCLCHWFRVNNMDILSPFIPVLCQSDWLFHEESCPHLDVVHPGCAWSSSPACTWHCSFHYLFLQATPLFPHGVTIVG